MENTISLNPCICSSKGYNLIVNSNVHFYAIYAFGILTYRLTWLTEHSNYSYILSVHDIIIKLAVIKIFRFSFKTCRKKLYEILSDLDKGVV